MRFVVLILSILLFTALPAAGQFTLERTHSGGANGDQFGGKVAAVGDVNGDGYSDYAVGARFADVNGTDSGSVTVYSGFDGAILHVFHGDSAGDNFGRFVAGAGDVNADGVDDIIVGAPGDDTNGMSSGSARVYDGLTGMTLYDFYGDVSGDHAGICVGAAGDINGDGHSDVIVGAEFADHGAFDGGSARIYSGADGALLITVAGDSTDDRFGFAVASIGDVNTDNIPDFVVGAPRDDNNGVDSGSIRVFSGVDGSQLYSVDGTVAGGRFGYSIASLCDVNLDNIGDIVVGARNADTANGTDTGSGHVISGSDGSFIYSVIGETSGDRFGHAVAGGDDIDLDGFGDFVIGAYQHPGTGSNVGRVYVYSGRTGQLLHQIDGQSNNEGLGEACDIIGDINDDGVADLIIGATENSVTPGKALVYRAPTLQLQSPVHPLFAPGMPSPTFGQSVTFVGDLNFDGLDDFVVGEPGFSLAHPGGVVRAYSGKTGGVLFEYSGSEANAEIGERVTSLGDINADGIDDLAVAGVGTTSIHQSGRVQILNGADGSLLHTFLGNQVGQNFGASVDCAGDVNSDGVPDIIVGAWGEMNGIGGQGAAYVYSGADFSTLYSYQGPNLAEGFGVEVGGLGDVDFDGFDDFIVFYGNPTGLRHSVYSGASGAQLFTQIVSTNAIHVASKFLDVQDIDCDGVAEYLVRWVDTSTGDVKITVYSAADGTEQYTMLPQSSGWGHRFSSGGDVDGDGFSDIAVSDVTFGAASEGRVFIHSGNGGGVIATIDGLPPAGIGRSVAINGDVNNDGYADVLTGGCAGVIVSVPVVYVYQSPQQEILHYDPVPETTQLVLKWIPDNGSLSDPTGTILALGATPGGSGLAGVSLAPANISIFGFTLLIANDPVNLIIQDVFGYGFGGEIVIPGVDRQNPFIAGVSLFIQFFEVSPIISASNGLRLLMVP